MIKHVPYYKLAYYRLAELIKQKYEQEKILENNGLSLYRLGIEHQKKILSTSELNQYRAFNLRFNSSLVCYDKDFYFVKEEKLLYWKKIQNELIGDNKFLADFHQRMWTRWENDRKVLQTSVDCQKKTRKAIIKKAFKNFSGFSYSKELSKGGNIVFSTHITGSFILVIFIDGGNLNYPKGIPSSLDIAIGVVEVILIRIF